jgi:hypothetical protein
MIRWMKAASQAFRVEVLTTRDIADWTEFSTEWVRRAINAGVTAPDGRTVKLEAETVSRTGRRRIYRVYRGAFIDFLTAIGWTRIPGQRTAGMHEMI